MAEFNDFSLRKDSYAAFDAQSLKSLIIKRLNTNNFFTDQNFEGSNLSSLIDIIAYAYHVLLFYLNRTGSESTFTTAELFENVNKIVKILNYNPVGNQTAILSFLAQANASLPPNTYTIPRYSYFSINGTNYSFNNDVTFIKSTNDTEILNDLQENNLLYQGLYVEYPSYSAIGEPFEILTLTVVDNNGENIPIDHFNIDVYVKDNTVDTPKWVKWTPTQSLFLERSNSEVYEIRLNENERYEIRFGNNVTGKQLNTGDEVAIYYIKTNGSQGEVGPGLLNNNKLFFYNTNRFNSIKTDTTPENLNIITSRQVNDIEFTNVDASTNFIPRETVSSMKINATNTFRTQYRLITSEDFINYVSKNYSNIISSVKAVNNWEYISGHLKYYFDLGVSRPNLESRVLFNQVKFADSCNFNNVYLYAVPKLEKLTSLTTRASYLNAAQKQLLLNDLQKVKLTTSEVIINDPVYMAVDIGIGFPGEPLSPDISINSFLEISRDITSKRNPESLKDQISQIFANYFSTLKDNLGSVVNLTDITNQILAIPESGITDINTERIEGTTSITIPGISLVIYNPIYPEKDIHVTTQDYQLPYFKFPFLNNTLDFKNKIKIITPSITSLTREY
jgi:hypothetical protein